MTTKKVLTIGMFLASALLGACSRDRSATAKTAVASAVVKTKMPAGAVSDQQLQRAADQAAQLASTQATSVVLVPPGSGSASPAAAPPSAPAPKS